MAMSSSNRSASPMSTRPNPNPNPNPNPSPFPNSIPNSRNPQESDSVARKSFTGSKFTKPSLVSQPRSFNPITPANSPAEYSRRSSFGKDGVRDNEQKENEQDPNSKPTRLQSPSPSAGKGFRNFMSPTISAASKINPSPRKKVLGERNEAVRTSASLSSGKFHFYSMDSSDDDNVLKSAAENCPQTNSTKFQNESTGYSVREPTINLTAQEDYKIESEPDVVVLSPDVSMAPKSTELTPLIETSPNLLPYDPKRNYLSPRPQFLHYKPNPRVEAYLNQGIRLEDDLVSENSSDPEISSEETSRSQDSGTEDGDSSSVEPESFQILERREPQMPKEGRLESFQTVEPRDSQMPKEGKIESFQIPEPRKSQLPKESVESEVVPKSKSGFFTWSKAFVLILVMSLAFPFAIRSPSIIDTWHQDQMMSKMYAESHKVADIAREHFEGLSHNLELKLVKTFSRLSLIISGIRDVEKFSPLKFKNSTVLQDGGRDCVFEQFARGTFDDKKGMLRNTEKSDYGDIPEAECNVEPEEHVSPPEESQAIMEPAELKEKELDQSSDVSPLVESFVFEDSETLDTQQGFVTQNNNVEAEHTQVNLDEPQDVIKSKKDQSTISSEGIHVEAEHTQEHADVISGAPDEPQDVIKGKKDQSTISSEGTHVEAERTQEHADVISGAPDEPQTVTEGKDESTVSAQDTGFKSEVESERFTMESVDWLKQLLADNIMATASLLTTAAILVCVKLRKYPTVSAVTVTDQLPVGKPSVSENPYSESGPVEFDMEGESCPSELSSFQRSSGYSKRGGSRVADDAQSHERKKARRNYKGESLASSSSEYTMGSPSFGSFTTYSIVPSKHGDEEVVTPVRRSSRIRNHVTYS